MRAAARVLLLTLSLPLGACAPPSSRRIDIEIVNRLACPVVLVARTGPIERLIELGPSARFSGWMVNPGGGRVEIEIVPK